jgi:hypothetical protein
MTLSLLCVGTLAYDTIETVHARRENVLGGSVTYFSLAACLYGGLGQTLRARGAWERGVRRRVYFASTRSTGV